VSDPEVSEPEEHPVIAGLLALVGVGLAVGLIAGLAALVGVQVLGLGNAGASDRATAQQSLYIPEPERTQASTGPLITLAPGPSESSDGKGKPSKGEKSSKEPDTGISLSAGQTSVSPMERIDLTGVYRGGEGAILQVQRFTAGKWTDFPVTVPVSDETFSTYVQSSQPGATKFRVVDTDSDQVSNEVRVTVG
jgi:hypothetical protein